ncbi:MAG TPA: 16S rRNA (guanine(527)-N(7))-methyltransferase RsmG [Phycisphaerales bacterium]|nr:16S rRNA (guanine(527)-N(7))-methyltransferase RsmG [Phycisphaerales bacterium]HRQ76451.1 16S rRNA (guanine(527)-N(7))-methyltransferase RsmG [Phycisphaerales bacterium]
MIPPPPIFLEHAAALSIAFEPGDLDRLGVFLDLLLEANTRFNLTTVTDPAEAWIRHILDSLSLLSVIASAEPKTIMDVGSGGGLPGIPLAIVLPHVQFTLLEATGKKATFLQEVVHEMGLTNVQVVNDRAETVGCDREHYREKYDMVTSRAVGRLAVLLELTSPFARAGGHVVAIKGEKAQEEIEEAKGALHRLHCQVAETIRTATNTIVVIEKLRPTPKMYPRRPGEPKRVPLQ